MKRIAVIGSSNVDIVLQLDRFPAVGETVAGKKLDKFPGGKGANQAYACGRLGGNISFLSLVGSDEHGDLILENMKTAGVDYSRVETTGLQPTGSAYIYVNNEGKNTIVVLAGANGLCDVAYVQRHHEIIRDSDIVVLQMEVPEETVYHTVGSAFEAGKIIIFNPAPAPAEIPDEILSKIDYFTPNETELEKLSGKKTDSLPDIEEAARFFLNKGVKNVIVTLGSKGAMLVSPTVTKLYPPPDVHVVDTTAAGDTFNAAVAVRLAENSSVEDAIIFANFASSLSVSRNGAQSSIPDRTEVEKFIKEYGEQV
ncbi:ribokinase [Breznakiella homolactica]|uniref:Ribokinase n=1 Tax=Breznakiella homolactica TaxID=2798577 RepID=A0A7T7XN28_9SPIR|nr:ribokinase [Breznakiella homolactica]QQO09376.1 ribokinase [Breznakiella homolactica]